MSDSFSFEGDEVSDFTAQLPAISLETEEAYQRGTLLTLKVQVRVRSVRIEEDRKGNLSRKHVLALEDATITDILTPAMRQALLDQAEEAAVAAEKAEREKEYTVSEEPTVEALHHDEPELPLDQSNEEVAPTADTDARQYDFVARDQQRGLSEQDDGDNDPEHAWMDDDDDGGVHVADSDLRAVVGF